MADELVFAADSVASVVSCEAVHSMKQMGVVVGCSVSPDTSELPAGGID
jgi:hypothetical protein